MSDCGFASVLFGNCPKSVAKNGNGNGNRMKDIADDIFNKSLISVLPAIPIKLIRILLVVEWFECESLFSTAPRRTLSTHPFLSLFRFLVLKTVFVIHWAVMCDLKTSQ